MSAGPTQYNKKKNWADPESYKQKGKPFKQVDFKPVSRLNDPEKIIRQRMAMDRAALKQSAPLVYNRKIVAVEPTGNQAPGIPLDEVRDMYEDSVESSALSDASYNAGYVRGNILEYISEAEKLQQEGKEYDRIDRTIRSEEEVEALRGEYRVLKGQSLNLPWWKPNMFPPDGTAVFFGRRRSGKSWLARELIYYYRHVYRIVIVITNTQQNDFWSDHVPFRFIHQYDQFVIRKIIEHQRAVIAHNKLNANNPSAIINPFIAVVLDDVVSDDLHHDPMLKQLFYEGRHNKIAIFITTQHPKALPPGVRANADLAVIFPQWAIGDQDAIREQYCNFFEDKEDFHMMLQEYTEDRHCVVFFLGDPTIRQLQALYVYKSSEPPAFITCSKEAWKNDDEHKRKYLEAQARILYAKGAAGNPSDSDALPGMHWLVDDSETDNLIATATFSG